MYCARTSPLRFAVHLLYVECSAVAVTLIEPRKELTIFRVLSEALSPSFGMRRGLLIAQYSGRPSNVARPSTLLFVICLHSTPPVCLLLEVILF